MTTVINTYGNLFDLVLEKSTGINDTPYEGLRVKRKGYADKHVINIDLDRVNVNYDGAPVKHRYYRVRINQGMRGTCNTLAETRECIAVLQEAVKAAEEIEVWMKLSGWWRED